MNKTRAILWGIVIAKAAVLALVLLWLLAFKLSRLALLCVLTCCGVYFLAARLQRRRLADG